MFRFQIATSRCLLQMKSWKLLQFCIKIHQINSLFRTTPNGSAKYDMCRDQSFFLAWISFNRRDCSLKQIWQWCVGSMIIFSLLTNKKFNHLIVISILRSTSGWSLLQNLHRSHPICTSPLFVQEFCSLIPSPSSLFSSTYLFSVLRIPLSPAQLRFFLWIWARMTLVTPY